MNVRSFFAILAVFAAALGGAPLNAGGNEEKPAPKSNTLEKSRAAAGDAFSRLDGVTDRSPPEGLTETPRGAPPSAGQPAPASHGEAEVSTSKTAPVWVTKPAGAFPENSFLAASGEGADRASAESAAKAALASMFSQSVTSTVTSVERGTNTNGSLQASSAVTIENQSKAAVDTLLGVEIREVWQDKKGKRWYAAAVIEKEAGRRNYASLLDSEEAEIERLLSGEITFDAIGRCAKAREEAGKAATNALILVTLDGPDRRAEVAALSRQAAERQEAARDSLPIDVRVTGDRGERVKAAFASAFTNAGFRTGNARSRYALAVTYSVESAAQGRYFNSRYTIDAVLQDTQTGAQILTYNFSDRASHPAGQSEAEARALTDAEKRIKEEFPQKLAAMEAN